MKSYGTLSSRIHQKGNSPSVTQDIITSQNFIILISIKIHQSDVNFPRLAIKHSFDKVNLEFVLHPWRRMAQWVVIIYKVASLSKYRVCHSEIWKVIWLRQTNMPFRFCLNVVLKLLLVLLLYVFHCKD